MKARGFRTAWGVAALAAVTVVAAGCSSSGSSASAGKWSTATSDGGSLSALVKAAKAEGTVSIFTSTDQAQVEAWSKGFTAEYGIKVTVYRQASAQIATTFKTQVDAGKVQADIFSSGTLANMQEFVGDKALAKYTPANAALFPADTTIPGYAYPLYQSTVAVGWSTKAVSPAVQRELEANPYEGLLDPSLKGKIIVIDPAAGGSGMAVYANLVANYSSQLGWNYLTKLAAQDPAVQTSSISMSQEVAAGTYSAAIFAPDGIWGPLAASGAPVQFQALPTSSVSQFYEGVTTDAPHPAAARLYDEWMSTLPAQEAMTAATGGTSVIKGWSDNRSFLAKTPWYTKPTTSWLNWQSDPSFTGENLTQFVAKWDSVFHVSS